MIRKLKAKERDPAKCKENSSYRFFFNMISSLDRKTYDKVVTLLMDPEAKPVDSYTTVIADTTYKLRFQAEAHWCLYESNTALGDQKVLEKYLLSNPQEQTTTLESKFPLLNDYLSEWVHLSKDYYLTNVIDAPFFRDLYYRLMRGGKNSIIPNLNAFRVFKYKDMRTELVVINVLAIRRLYTNLSFFKNLLQDYEYVDLSKYLKTPEDAPEVIRPFLDYVLKMKIEGCKKQTMANMRRSLLAKFHLFIK